LSAARDVITGLEGLFVVTSSEPAGEDKSRLFLRPDREGLGYNLRVVSGKAIAMADPLMHEGHLELHWLAQGVRVEEVLFHGLDWTVVFFSLGEGVQDHVAHHSHRANEVGLARGVGTKDRDSRQQVSVGRQPCWPMQYFLQFGSRT